MGNIIFTNNALKKMAKFSLGETQVRDAFNNGKVEKAKFGGRWSSVKKYSGYEVGVNWDKDRDGKYMIISAWKRGRR